MQVKNQEIERMLAREQEMESVIQMLQEAAQGNQAQGKFSS